MRRRRPEAGMNFWPGYVDAMTNVVLNLLFMVAIFGIALMVFNSKRHATTLRQAGMAEAAGAGGWPHQGEAPDAASAPASPGSAREWVAAGDVGRGNVGVGDASGASRTGLLGNGSGEQDAAGRKPVDGRGTASTIASGIAGPTGSTAATVPPVRPRSLAADAPTAGAQTSGAVAAGRGPDSASTSANANANANAGLSRDPKIAPLAAYPFGDTPPGRLKFSVIDAYQRRLMPGVRIERRAAAGNARLLTIQLKTGIEPLAALRQPVFGHVLRAMLGLRADGMAPASLRLWSATRLADPIRRRAAYLALVEARNQVLALGYPPAAIEIRLIEGEAATSAEQQIFLLAIPAVGN